MPARRKPPGVCGCTLEDGEPVFCDDPRLPELVRSDLCLCKDRVREVEDSEHVGHRRKAPRRQVRAERGLPGAP